MAFHTILQGTPRVVHPASAKAPLGKLEFCYGNFLDASKSQTNTFHGEHCFFCIKSLPKTIN